MFSPNEQIKRRDVEKPHLVIGIIHRPLLIIDLHFVLVFGSPLHIEDLVFPGVLQPVFFFVGDLKAVPNEVAGEEFDVRTSRANDDCGVSGLKPKGEVVMKSAVLRLTKSRPRSADDARRVE